MKAILNNLVKAVYILVILIMTSITVKAQFNIGGPGTDGSGINGNGTPNNSPAVPFDGGLSLVLLVSGVGYAAKKQKPINNR